MGKPRWLRPPQSQVILIPDVSSELDLDADPDGEARLWCVAATNA